MARDEFISLKCGFPRLCCSAERAAERAGAEPPVMESGVGVGGNLGFAIDYFAERHLLSLPDLGPRRHLFHSERNLKTPSGRPAAFT